MGEEQYLFLLNKILSYGIKRGDRTNTGTLSLFGEKMEFDISNSIPLLTTKKVFYQNVIKELLWFISGSSTVKPLQEQGVKFWDANTSRDFLDSQGLINFEEGELGAGYGFQWRHFGANYTGVGSYINQGVDQLRNAIELLKRDPYSRRIIVSAWNPADLDKVALPPCHIMFQFYCVDDPVKGKCLDSMLYQRSGDMFLGVPFNIASYSILTYMVAHLVGMKPRRFIHVIGDAHIYLNHVEQCNLQLSRKPKTPPSLSFNRRVDDIDDFKFEDFNVVGYEHHSHIKADMSV